jgi:alpha-beta hydrolase superfamily lysophospholipase
MRKWLPEARPRALIALIHGYAEHTGRYERHAANLCAAGIGVVSYDHAGHGHSGGKRGYISDYANLLADCRDFLDHVLAHHPDTPVFLLGHSLGGSLAALAAATHQEKLAGLIMSSPAIALMEAPWLQKLALSLSRVVPRLVVKPLNRSHLSTDPGVAAAFEQDPLTFRSRISTRTAAEIIRVGKAAMEAAPEVRLPLLLFHGTSDLITSPKASADFYESAASQDKSISFFRGMYHETLNEPGGKRVLDGVIDFVEDHDTDNWLA